MMQAVARPMAFLPGLPDGYVLRSAVDRRFWSVFALSLAIHAAALAWVQRTDRELPPVLPPLLATLHMTVTSPAEAPVEQPPAPAAIPEPARQPAPRREQRSAQRVVEAAASPLSAPPTVAAMAESTASGKADPAAAALAPATPSVTEPPRIAAPSQNSLLEAYRKRLTEVFAGQQQYPRVAALRGWEGEVRLRLRVARKGNLVTVHLDHSSGYDVLDQHALSMLEQLSSLPPLPEGLDANEIQVVVPVNYKLKKTT